MKKIIAFVSVCLVGIIGIQQISAQFVEDTNKKFNISSITNGEITFGVRSGLNFASLSLSEDDDDLKSESRFSYSFGLIADIPVTQNIYIQPGLFLTNKGHKYTYKEEDYYGEYKGEITIELPYIQIPILASYRHNISNDLKWNIDFGPYLSYGIGSGKVKYKETYDGETETESEDAFGDGDDNFGINRFDAGLCFGTGVTFNKAYIGIQYELGLSDITNKDAWDKDFSAKTRNFSINIGYNF